MGYECRHCGAVNYSCAAYSHEYIICINSRNLIYTFYEQIYVQQVWVSSASFPILKRLLLALKSARERGAYNA